MKSQKDKNKNRKRRALGITAGIALCTLILGTFAWDLYEDSVENKFGNAAMQGSVEVEEIFEDPHMTPGKEIQKEIWLNNTSSTPTFVRASFKEEFTKLKGDTTGQALVESHPDSAISGTTYLPNTNPNAIPVIVDALQADAKAAANLAASGDEFDDWYDITSLVTFTGGTPADVTVYAKSRKETTSIVGGGSETKVTTEYIAVRKFDLANVAIGDVSKQLVVKYPGSATDVAQQVTGDLKATFTPDGSGTPGAGSVSYTFDNVVFDFYEGMDTTLTADWTDTTGAPLTPPLATAIDNSVIEPNIALNYTALNMSSTVVAGHWYYNQADGYFYWLDVVASGGSTANFLESVQLADTVGTEYDYLDYKLEAIGEGVITNMAAVTSEWGLVSGDPIYDFYKGLPGVTP